MSSNDDQTGFLSVSIKLDSKVRISPSTFVKIKRMGMPGKGNCPIYWAISLQVRCCGGH
ncbi:hypothetical protein [Okeania sp. SIO2B9]|uniref:hypothetical protein n=1 Tax=Okeania sp. SIO2B9 TaxID=2607782 RepID=UPI00257EF17F|nr:hypothetical protein [Okeania sp. SIO2B9]